MYRDNHTQLLAWYHKNGRHALPWRNTEDVYHVYLSEIMLQQTQVSRVKEEYYPRFLEKFPTIQSLADAPLDDVLASWSGLGYYRRAKNLHASALIAQNRLPNSFEGFLDLPGVGQYTASAVCSFAYEHTIPVVDTNIARVLKRFFALKDVKDRIVWDHAANFLNHKESRAHNLALMDLGSMICSAKTPECSLCPLQESCLGKSEAELYTQVKKKEYINMELFFAIVIQDGKIALKNSEDGMYADMLVLPSIDPIEENFVGSFKHAYTKYRLKVNLYRVDEISEDVHWFTLEEFDTLPISSLTKKAKKYF